MSKNFELLRQAGISLGVGETLLPSRRSTSTETVRPARNPERLEPEWMHGLRILRKHWRLSALFAAVVTTTVVIVTLAMKPVYEPVARVEVDPPGETFSLDGSGQSGNDTEYLETQAQNLKSDRLAIGVIRRLHLDLNKKVLQSGSSDEFKNSTDSANAVQLTPAENSALRSFRAHLMIKRDTASRLIAVSYASHDPSLAAEVTNSVVDAFVEDTYKDRHDAITKSSQWLARQLDDIRGRMEASNRVLADFQKSIGVADLDDNRSTFTEQMTELNRQLTQAQADRIQLEALLHSVEAGTADALPDVRTNPSVQRLNDKLAELRTELSQSRVVYGANHPNIRKLESQIQQVQTELAAQKASILSSVRTNYAAARARERLMDSEIKGTTKELSQVARYNLLKKEAEANSQLYNSLYAKVKEAGIAAASKSSNIRIVDRARVLDSPTRPDRTLNILVGLLAAVFGGIGLAFLREQFDRRITSPEDVRHWIGTSNIAIVPLFFSDSQKLPPSNGNKFAVASGNGKLAPGVRFLLDRPHSAEAEALRSLYTSVMLARPDNAPQALLVVSSFPGEGKTTVAVNLAMAIAQHGRTCLVDADLRRGRIGSAFGIASGSGLTHILNGTAPLDSTLVPVPSVTNLTVLPAHAGSVNAGQLICSDKMRNLLAELRGRFQFIVIDSAPLLPFADARALSILVDGLIFVSRSGVTTRDVINRSLELLNEVQAAPILEFVLNAADLNSPEYRSYQYGYENYNPIVK